MISADSIYPIGYVSKTHGIRGELNVRLDTHFNPEDFRFLIFDIENIFVPFVISQSRGSGHDTRLVSIEGIDTVEEAATFVGKTAYVLLSELREHPDYDAEAEDSEGLYLSDLVGYTLNDENGDKIGVITGYNDDTENYLLEVSLTDGKSVYIPFVDEWIVDLDSDTRNLSVDLPGGLI